MTGSGFINSAAMKYNPTIGQNPVNNRSMSEMARVQKTEKSKYSAMPLHTPNMTPFRER
jgi:hypothetical protein